MASLPPPLFPSAFPGVSSGSRPEATFPTRLFAGRGDYGSWSGGKQPWISSDGKLFGTAFDLVMLLIALNVLVFLLWMYEESRGYPGIKFMQDNFTVSQRNIREGRVWTIVNHFWSHRSFSHLLFNMMSLYFLGSPLLQQLGPTRFFGLYMAAGVAGGFAHLAYYNILSGNWSMQPRKRLRQNPAKDGPAGQGASGAVNGVVMTFALINPFAKLMVFPIPIPINAIYLCGAYLLYDVYAAMHHSQGDRIGHAAHIGGAAVGALYYFGWLRKYFRWYRRS